MRCLTVRFVVKDDDEIRDIQNEIGGLATNHGYILFDLNDVQPATREQIEYAQDQINHS